MPVCRCIFLVLLKIEACFFFSITKNFKNPPFAVLQTVGLVQIKNWLLVIE